MARERYKPIFRDDESATLLTHKNTICETQVELGIRERVLQALACPPTLNQHIVKDMGLHQSLNVGYRLVSLWLNAEICRAQNSKHYLQAIRYQHNAYLLQDGIKTPLQLAHELWLQPILVRL